MRALAGRPVPVHGDGTQTRDFTYVDAVAEVVADGVCRRVTHPTPLNAAWGSRVSLLEVIGTLEEILDAPLPRHHLPDRAGDVHDTQADPSRLLELFPDIAPVPLREGLERTVTWHRSLGGDTAGSGTLSTATASGERR